jgi:16S rRNA (cytosine1402-N4)-methyltransferase
METPDGGHQRRVRYRGTHPRAFAEKYKELDAARYADDVAKVLAKGNTPAGTHRPIMVDEILQALHPRPGEVAVDGTLGYGGHAQALLPALAPGGRVYGLDIDPLELPKTEARLRAAGFGPDVFQARQTNFAALPKLLKEEGLPGVDLFLADLGVSSMQLDNPARGFTFKRTAPLDLRMNPQKGQPAAALLATLGEDALAALLRDNADEPRADAIAHAVAHAAIATTTDLAEAVRAVVPADDADDAIRRTFQALRIAVNGELSALDSLLAVLPHCLNPGGRAAILTFHSGEDRRVKRAFADGLAAGVYRAIAPEVIRATPDERRANPRATAAKLRWAERSG